VRTVKRWLQSRTLVTVEAFEHTYIVCVHEPDIQVPYQYKQECAASISHTVSTSVLMLAARTANNGTWYSTTQNISTLLLHTVPMGQPVKEGNLAFL
jgi:hypothetical protein